MLKMSSRSEVGPFCGGFDGTWEVETRALKLLLQWSLGLLGARPQTTLEVVRGAVRSEFPRGLSLEEGKFGSGSC